MISNRVSTDETDDSKDDLEQSDDKESSDWRVVVASLGLVARLLQFWHCCTQYSETAHLLKVSAYVLVLPQI